MVAKALPCPFLTTLTTPSVRIFKEEAQKVLVE
jgi:hypothetical protein